MKVKPHEYNLERAKKYFGKTGYFKFLAVYKKLTQLNDTVNKLEKLLITDMTTIKNIFNEFITKLNEEDAFERGAIDYNGYSVSIYRDDWKTGENKWEHRDALAATNNYNRWYDKVTHKFDLANNPGYEYNKQLLDGITNTIKSELRKQSVGIMYLLLNLI